MEAIRVFQMNDCDWMAATTKQEAIADYRANYGGADSERDFEESLEETTVEVSEEAMSRLSYSDVEAEPDAGGKFPTRTFREQLDKMIAEGQIFPCFFASTEY